jgi:hypothetical protein
MDDPVSFGVKDGRAESAPVDLDAFAIIRARRSCKVSAQLVLALIRLTLRSFSDLWWHHHQIPPIKHTATIPATIPPTIGLR